METAIALIAILGFLLAPSLMEKMPRLGYLMTWPVRLLLPFAASQAHSDPMTGASIGVGLALLFSFEYDFCWKLGLLVLVGPSLVGAVAWP